MAFDGNMISFSNVKSFMRFREGKKRSKKRKKGKKWPSRYTIQSAILKCFANIKSSIAMDDVSPSCIISVVKLKMKH